MSKSASLENIQTIGNVLNDRTQPLKDRFRALFTLKNLGGKEAIDAIARCFDDSSALLKHELAYCLGQMQDAYVLPVLVKVLEDKSQEPMVRHEAGEAIGAIGKKESVDILQKYASDPVVEVAETCQLSLQRIEWLHGGKIDQEKLSNNPYVSVDPAPPCVNNDLKYLQQNLLDESLPLFQRYRAMFSLRNLGSREAVQILAQGLKCSSALFRHEIAYVLGQIQSDACVKELTENLQDLNENPMVRHECAEALGSIANDDCMRVLGEYLKDQERVVKESCLVALDMCDYENSGQFQYANSLVNMKDTNKDNVTSSTS